MACLDVAGHKFLGATLTGIDTTLGWGSSGTSMSLSLVEDTCKGDNFAPPIVGSPVCVNVGDAGWNFGGFLDGWELKSSVSAGHTYTVKITDPTQLLENYHCILGNYDGGVFGVPNLANVFGYLENYLGGACVDFMNGDKSGVNYTPAFGWGGSHTNAGGIPSTLVVTALQAILNGAGGTFGTYPLYRNFSYQVDLSRLTSLPVYNYNYRIAGDSLNLLDVIDRMCKDSGFDYYCGLNCAGDTVTIYPVPINNFGGFAGANIMDVSAGDIDAGDIAKAAGVGTYYASKNIGLDHRKEPLNAFTVGDNFQGIHQVTKVETCDPASATIWPYWGQDWNDNPIIAAGCGDEHCFMADSREWQVIGVGAFYPLCIAEMRAALVSKQGWETWMSIRKKAFWDLMDWEKNKGFLGLIKGALNGAINPAWWGDDKKKGNKAANERKNNVVDSAKNMEQLYNAILQMAREFYGKKYMVAIPFVCRYLEDETGELKMNWEKSDAGWSEPYTVSVIGLGNPTPGLLVFKNEEGKITPFVRYDNAEKLDLTFLQKGDFYFESGYVWIKCNVEKFVRTGSRFWAVIDLKSPVFLAKGEDNEEAGRGFFIRLLKDAKDMGEINQAELDAILGPDGFDNVEAGQWYLFDGPRAVIPHAAAIPLKSNKVSYGPWYGGYLGGKTEYQRDTTFNPWNYGNAAQMQLAGVVHTTFKVSTIEVAEKGSLTAPGYPVAFLADRAGIITGTGNFGPIITQIQVKHDTSGVQTTYQFKTFAPKWGQLSKQILDSMQRRGQAVNRANHKILQRMIQPPPPNAAIFRLRFLWLLAMQKPGEKPNNKAESTHDMITASSFLREEAAFPDAREWESGSGDRAFQVVTIGKWADDFHFLNAFNDDDIYSNNTAGIGQIGIFRPFSTEANSHMAEFEDISDGSYDGASNYTESVSFDGGAAKTNKFYPKSPVPPVNEEYNMPITIKTLNPFKGGNVNTGIYGFEHMNDSESSRHDIDFVVRGQTWPVEARLNYQLGSSNNIDDTHYRAMSLRGPLIITGWGFDLDGKPVPIDDTSTKPKFKKDWLRKPHEWKTGALDVRWDEERGLWVAPPSFKLVNAICCKCVGPKTVDFGWFQLDGDDGGESKLDKTGAAVNGIESDCNCDTSGKKQVMALNKTGKIVLPDAKVLLYFDTRNHKYYIITAPDPIVIAAMDELMLPEEATDEVYTTATISKGIHDLGTFNDDCGKIIKITNTLKQPICKDSKAFIYLTKCNDSASDGGSDDYNFEGEVLQAEFEPLTVVTSVDCYEASDTGEPTLEICDRRIYVQAAWTIEDCGDDDEKKRFDTKGWRPDTDEDNKKNKEATASELCPDDWNNDTV